jgi:signal transduction histidine kinase
VIDRQPIASTARLDAERLKSRKRSPRRCIRTIGLASSRHANAAGTMPPISRKSSGSSGPTAPSDGCTTIADELLDRRVSDPAARKPLDVMARQVRRMSRLVDDLLDMSRIAQSKIELRREPVALASVVRGAIEASASASKARRHTIELHVVDEVEVIGNAQRLGQMFDNLLGNAVKYTPDDGRIVVRIARDGAEGLVTVRDSGIGIAPDVLPRIFDIFVQSERSLDRSQGGLGIGLTLVDRLTRLHGGSVFASSDGVNQGSEFVVRLPIAGDSINA